jgi:DNA-binding NarL/FixJ family response regulator
MTTTVAILTGHQNIGERLRRGLQASGAPLLVRVVRDEPDLSFRSLRLSDIVVCGPDVAGAHLNRLLRALGCTGKAGRLVRVVPIEDARRAVLESLANGARAVIREDHFESEIDAALRDVTRGRLFLSPDLIPLVLERYRELCGELRRMREAARQETEGLMRSSHR